MSELNHLNCIVENYNYILLHHHHHVNILFDLEMNIARFLYLLQNQNLGILFLN